MKKTHNKKKLLATDLKLLENTRRWRRTYKGLTANMYAKILERSRNKGWDVSFALKKFRQWIQETDAEQVYYDWSHTGFKKELRPSVDRIDCRKPYTFDNMQVITVQENRRKGDKEKLLLWGKTVIAIKGKHAWHFPNIKTASQRTGINRNNISSVLHGKRKTAGGYEWKFQHENKNLL